MRELTDADYQRVTTPMIDHGPDSEVAKAAKALSLRTLLALCVLVRIEHPTAAYVELEDSDQGDWMWPRDIFDDDKMPIEGADDWFADDDDAGTYTSCLYTSGWGSDWKQYSEQMGAYTLIPIDRVLDELYPPLSDVTVRFRAEAWHNDYTIEADSEGENQWRVGVPMAARIAANTNPRDLDFVLDDPHAPEWTRKWDGPFTIEVVEGD